MARLRWNTHQCDRVSMLCDAGNEGRVGRREQDGVRNGTPLFEETSDWRSGGVDPSSG